MKSGLFGLFAWFGIPVLFAGAARLMYFLAPRAHALGSFPVQLGVMLALVAVGTFAVREGQQPRHAWVVPTYLAVMIVLSFVILAVTGCLSGADCTT